MLLDARSLSEGDVLKCDICIIGGGAAGITIARELIGSGLKVILLESGGENYDEATQSLYHGDIVGFPTSPIDESRLRYFGGSTNHWAGNCITLTDVDFESRPGIPHSGWPIGKSDIEPYYARALAYVEAPTDRPFDLDHWANEAGGSLMPLDTDKLRNILFYESTPTAFGATYEDDLKISGNVAVYLHANVLELSSNGTASEVTAAQAAAIDGPRFEVRARRFVLATGGMEVPRLLLLSNSTAPAGLGNQNDLVGRFFMDHPSLRPALSALVMDSAANFNFYTDTEYLPDGGVRAAIAPAQKLVTEEEIGNFIIFLFDHHQSPGSRSATAFYRGVRKGEMPEGLTNHIANMLTDLDGVTNATHEWVAGDGNKLIDRTWISPWIGIECHPNPDSRITLSETERDLFDQPRIALDWQLSDPDIRTMQRATELFAEEFGRLGYGRVWTDTLDEGFDWPAYTPDAKHHMGTTRMSADAKTGVVDADCKVHGISNLYIAGSAVFPTYGYATPTFTIVALALRLSEHLKEIGGT